MLEQLLPPAAAVTETREDTEGVVLYPEEEFVVARAVPKRRREFTTGRACARSSLERLGLRPQAIPTGARGAPQWPDGIVGSITHCEGYRACAVASSAELSSIGIDAELDAELPSGVLGDIALPQERRHLGELAREEPGVSWDRLLFSAKESVYKAWFPLAQRWLDFEDAVITFDLPRRSFSAQLLIPGPPPRGLELSSFSGRWSVREGIVLTAIAVPAG